MAEDEAADELLVVVVVVVVAADTEGVEEEVEVAEVPLVPLVCTRGSEDSDGRAARIMSGSNLPLLAWIGRALSLVVDLLGCARTTCELLVELRAEVLPSMSPADKDSVRHKGDEKDQAQVSVCVCARTNIQSMHSNRSATKDEDTIALRYRSTSSYSRMPSAVRKERNIHRHERERESNIPMTRGCSDVSRHSLQCLRAISNA